MPATTVCYLCRSITTTTANPRSLPTSTIATTIASSSRALHYLRHNPDTVSTPGALHYLCLSPGTASCSALCCLHHGTGSTCTSTLPTDTSSTRYPICPYTDYTPSITTFISNSATTNTIGNAFSGSNPTSTYSSATTTNTISNAFSGSNSISTYSSSTPPATFCSSSTTIIFFSSITTPSISLISTTNSTWRLSFSATIYDDTTSFRWWSSGNHSFTSSSITRWHSGNH
uniref:Uncharacterized protein n=1 Tax=Brassica oleracea TaxID=3712 RepID=A0A3P6FE85_BRAOL|nr:unnamed protein product [Brassica oleracea]